MDEAYKAALSATLHRLVDQAMRSEHGELDLSRQPELPTGSKWLLQLRWTDGDGCGSDDLVEGVARRETQCG